MDYRGLIDLYLANHKHAQYGIARIHQWRLRTSYWCQLGTVDGFNLRPVVYAFHTSLEG